MRPAISTGWCLARAEFRLGAAAYRNPALPLLGGVHPHGETRPGAGQMEPLVAEIALVLTQAASCAEYRWLMRLHTITLRCAHEEGELLFIGD
jgi:hypothetical protein